MPQGDPSCGFCLIKMEYKIKMNTNDNINFYDDLDDNEATDNFIDSDKRRTRFPEKHFKTVRNENAGFVNAQDDSRGNFKFTYHAARFEEWWLLDSLGELYEHQWISDVLSRVKGGKEASVYQCRAGTAVKANLAAAKVYRPRSLRNLRNDGMYRQGREDLNAEGKVVIDDGQLHAMRKNTEYGRELLHQSWIAYEFTSLQTLHAAGADVPEPYTMTHNAILMGFVGDEDTSAPTLSEIHLDGSEAKLLFERTLRNIDILLKHERIHGDLSAYNILYWDGDIVLIDFPQAISPRINKNAFKIFSRDIIRICEYFAKQGVKSDARKLAEELWNAHNYQMFEIPEDE